MRLAEMSTPVPLVHHKWHTTELISRCSPWRQTGEAWLCHRCWHRPGWWHSPWCFQTLPTPTWIHVSRWPLVCLTKTECQFHRRSTQAGDWKQSHVESWIAPCHWNNCWQELGPCPATCSCHMVQACRWLVPGASFSVNVSTLQMVGFFFLNWIFKFIFLVIKPNLIRNCFLVRGNPALAASTTFSTILFSVLVGMLVVHPAFLPSVDCPFAFSFRALFGMPKSLEAAP